MKMHILSFCTKLKSVDECGGSVYYVSEITQWI
jgi:hypothetical protein